MGRTILGIIAGIVAAFGMIWLTDTIGHSFYPVPSDVSVQNFEQMGAYINSMPAGAMAFVVGAWFAGALIGGIVATLASRRRWTAWVIAAVVVLASLLNVLMIPHPIWMQIGAVVAPLLGGLFAAHFAHPQELAPPATQEVPDAGV